MRKSVAGRDKRQPRRGHCLGIAPLALLLWSCTAFPPARELFDPQPPPEPVPLPPPLVEPVSRLSWPAALLMARERNPRIDEAKRRVARAEALLDEARAQAYPTLDGRAGYVRFIDAASFRGRTGTDASSSDTRTRFVTGSGSEIYSGGFDLGYTFYDGGVAYYGREAAAAAVTANEAEFDRVLNELEFLVSETFLNLIIAERAIRIAQEALSFTEKEEKRARLRADVGDGLRVDALRFATRASEERLALNRTKADRRILLAALSELLGATIPDEVKLDEPTEELPIPGGDLVAAARETRPEVRALRARRTEAQRRLAREGATRWPTLSLFSSYGFLALDSLKLDRDSDEFLVGASASVNLFEGGATIARMAAIKNEIAVLESQERQLALVIEREVRKINAELAVARENVAVTEESVELSDEVLGRVTAQYREGEATVIDVTQAQLDRTRAQLAFVTSRVNLLRSQANLRTILGLGLFRD